jgi:hypothetical protein
VTTPLLNTIIDPAYAQQKSIVDPNGIRTEAIYDGSGLRRACVPRAEP